MSCVSHFAATAACLQPRSFDGTARIWDAQTGLAVTPPLVHKETVTWVAFSPDGSRLATASADGTVANLGCRHGQARRSAAQT